MKLRRTQELKCRSLMKSIALAYAGHGIASGCRRRCRALEDQLGHGGRGFTDGVPRDGVEYRLDVRRQLTDYA
jgi:hypothetical protein